MGTITSEYVIMKPFFVTAIFTLFLLILSLVLYQVVNGFNDLDCL